MLDKRKIKGKQVLEEIGTWTRAQIEVELGLDNIEEALEETQSDFVKAT